MKYEAPSAERVKDMAGELGFPVDDATVEEMRPF